jgi:DNA-binding response OmpR family regulator
MLKLVNQGKIKIDLTRSSILLADGNAQGMDILAQVLGGFGVRTPYRCETASDAKVILGRHGIDLIITDAQLPDMDGHDLITWLRRSELEPNRTAPAIILSGHTPATSVKKGRDSGVSYTIAKPLAPRVLMERMIWLARENRAFIKSDIYAGPDRRFRALGPPPETNGRRNGDLPPEVGTAKTPNMSQDDIDTLLQPQKASL